MVKRSRIASSHTLQANATCGFFCVYNTKTVTFTVPQIVISAAGVNFPNIPVSASLTTPRADVRHLQHHCNATVPVTITANPPVVQFMNAPQCSATNSLNVTIVGGETGFYVQGVQGTPIGTSFTLTGIGAGCQIGMQTGMITQ
jgi:hypothetical protein